MRLTVALFVLTISTPVCAQTIGSTSGAVSIVSIDPASATTTSYNHLITPPTVAAPGLAAAGVETCLGSASAGLSLMGGGFTFGGTKVDEGCTIRLLARQLYAFGFHNAALALMCQDQHVGLAMAVTGTPCPPLPAQLAHNDPISPPPPPLQLAQAGPLSILPPLASAEDQPTAPLSQEAQSNPFTKEEAALFERESQME